MQNLSGQCPMTFMENRCPPMSVYGKADGCQVRKPRAQELTNFALLQ